MKKHSAPPVAVFAALDGSGGAGLLADCRALAAQGCLPLAVGTAITAQNLDGVQGYWPLAAQQVQRQFSAYAAAPLAAVKIGVVGRAAAAIAGCLKNSAAPIVWDPVLAPTAGAAFADARALAALRRHLLPLAAVATPNRRELLQLSGQQRVAAAADALFAAGATHLLITDVDGRGAQVRHVLLGAQARRAPLWEAACQRRRGDYHGSGCLFSSTLAARLARGDSMPAAAETAHRAVAQAMQKARRLPALGRQYFLG